jgi:hypothetical protein
MSHIDCVLPAHMLKPAPAVTVDREQWLREQLAQNWWDSLPPVIQVYIHEALRRDFSVLQDVQ